MQMNSPFISIGTHQAFREHMVEWTIREISDAFQAAGIDCDRSWQPSINGQRRILVEQYYHTLNWSNFESIKKILHVFENILRVAEKRPEEILQVGRGPGVQTYRVLIDWLQKDGFSRQGGKIIPRTPEMRRRFEEERSDFTISEITRRNIFDEIKLGNISWSGRLPEEDFLARIFDLKSLPSTDGRFRNAEGDICQHRTNNNDWPVDWIFTDSRFDLMHTDDNTALRFLCEILHPAVTSDANDVAIILSIFNSHLAADGWELIAQTQISGRPIFAGIRQSSKGSPALGAAKPVIQALDAGYVSQQIKRMEDSIQSDPDLAIGTAKEFVETICKTILREFGKSDGGDENILQLVKQVREKLNLLPESIPEKSKGADSIKRILNNLGTVAQGLAELRSLYGTGHGKSANSKGLQPRHARLAVGAATTLGLFLFETYQERNRKNESSNLDAQKLADPYV